MTPLVINPADSPAKLVADLERYINEAHALIETHEIISLAGLDDAVDALCQRVLSLSTEDARPFSTQLHKLREKLDQLQQRMLKEKTLIADEIGTINKRQKAAQAYRAPVEEKK